MKKKEIKALLSRFDDVKMPDKQKIVSSCGAEYRYVPKESAERPRKRALSPLMLVIIIIMIIASIVTVSANIDGVQGFVQYVERKIRVFYGDGSYSDVVIGDYVTGGTSGNISMNMTQQTQMPPSGIVPKPSYWEEHEKDVSGYTAKVTHIQPSSDRLIMHIVGGEDFKVYSDYVKLERREKGSAATPWKTIFERQIPTWDMTSGTYVSTTNVYENEGDFSVNIYELIGLLESKYEYRVTIKVCSPSGELDAGDVSAVFSLSDFY